MQSVPDHQAHSGEGGIQPVDGWLACLEVVQVDPAAGLSGGVDDRPGCAPVGFLDAGFVEDDPLEPADDVSGFLQRLFRLRTQICRILPLGHVRQQVPVLLRDVDHVIDARVVPKVHFGQAEVGSLAGVARNDVIDDRAAVVGGDLAHLPEFILRAKHRVDRHADPVKVPVNAGSLGPAADASGQFDGAGVEGPDPDLPEGFPHARIAQSRKEGLAGLRDEGQGVSGKPDGSTLDGGPGVGMCIGVLPHAGLPGELPGQHVGVSQHCLVPQPLDIRRVAAVKLKGWPGKPDTGACGRSASEPSGGPDKTAHRR